MGFLDGLVEYQNERRRLKGDYLPEETADAWKKFNRQMANQFDIQNRQKVDAEHGRNPGGFVDPNAPEFQTSPLERWRQQVQALTENDNPILQKKGIEMLQAYHQRATQAPSKGQADPEGVKVGRAMGLKDGTPEMTAFLKNHYKKQEASKIAGAQYADELGLEGDERDQFILDYISNRKPTRQYAPKYVTPAEAQKLRWEDNNKTDPIVGQNWEDIRGKVRTIDEGEAMFKSANDAVNTIEGALYGTKNKDGEYEPGIYEDEKWKLPAPASTIVGAVGGKMEEIAQVDERYKAYQNFRAGVAAPIIRAMGEKGALSDKDIQRALNLLPSVAGLDVDIPSVGKLKLRYLRSIIDSDRITVRMLDRAEKEIEALKEKENVGNNPTPENAPEGWK